MPHDHRLVIILCKSKKNQALCVAGIIASGPDAGKWVRLVAKDDSNHNAVSHMYMQNVNVLDVGEVEIIAYTPSRYQPENILVNTAYALPNWGSWELQDVLEMHPPERHKYLYGNMETTLSESEMRNLGYSLTLIEVFNLTIQTNTNMFGRYRSKCSFTYEGNIYRNIAVTDLDYCNESLYRKIKHAYLVVSLPDIPYIDDGLYYKFVAKVFVA